MSLFMHGYAVALVLLSAVLHATWNAQLKSNCRDRSQFMASMCTAMGLIALACIAVLPLPCGPAWSFIALSGSLHLAYNILLLQNYRLSNFSEALSHGSRHFSLPGHRWSFRRDASKTRCFR